MRIGVPKEIKTLEFRVGLVPSSVKELTRLNHTVFVETKAGEAIGFDDKSYKESGAIILETAKDVFDQSDMIVKVKEPQMSEYSLLRENQILFTYLHLAPDPVQAKALMESKCIAIAYETVTDDKGGLPLLTPMSEVAGRMSVQVGAWMLEKNQGGEGVLLSGVPGVSPAEVIVLGGGVVGTNAAKIAHGMGANVTIVDKNLLRLREIDFIFGGNVKTCFSTEEMISNLVTRADLVIGAVLVAGRSAPKLVTKEMVKQMKKGSVLVDVAIDQGGCFETSKPTSHASPYFDVDGVLHYCVTNMPGAVAKTSAKALNNATLAFVLALAQKGYHQAFLDDPHLLSGLNVFKGSIAHKAVAMDLKLDFVAYK